MSAAVTALEERNAHLEREMQRLIVRAQPRHRRVGAAAIDASAVVVSSFASAWVLYASRRIANSLRCRLRARWDRQARCLKPLNCANAGACRPFAPRG
jgi:hypothetical protein